MAMRRRAGRVAGGLVAVALCLAAGACAPGGAGAGRGSPRPGITDGILAVPSPAPASVAAASSGHEPAGSPAASPSEMVLRSGELKGYVIAPLRYEEAGGTERSDTPSCAPLADLVNLAPEPAPAASVLRTAVDASRAGRDDQTVVTLLLAAYADDGAASLLDRVRRAVDVCAGGFGTRGDDGPAAYFAVTALPAPRVGQDALAFRMVCDRDGHRSPLVFTVVRGAGAVVVFSAANYLDGEVPEIPPALVTAQAGKLPPAP
ncbi:hypothetical protein [Streptomyces sp. NPDC060198]|uniref:hypothetical protein n=1 Tax=Streptomyces sp. NPDC060198 TaxID=3347070 RepID=UPI0036628254